MSILYKAKLHRKGTKVLALLRPAKIYRARTFTIYKQRYVYLLEVIFEHEEKPIKVMPIDIEEYSEKKL